MAFAGRRLFSSQAEAVAEAFKLLAKEPNNGDLKIKALRMAETYVRDAAPADVEKIWKSKMTDRVNDLDISLRASHKSNILGVTVLIGFLIAVPSVTTSVTTDLKIKMKANEEKITMLESKVSELDTSNKMLESKVSELDTSNKMLVSALEKERR